MLLGSLVFLGACGRGSDMRTLKVLSTRDDSPIPGMNVEVRAKYRLWEDGPLSGAGVWYLTTDSAGEVRVSQPRGTYLDVYVTGNDQFTTSMHSVKYYEHTRGAQYVVGRDAWQSVQYLTPVADYNYEAVRYFYRVAADIVDGKARDTGAPISVIVNYYTLAKKHTLSDRELAPLRQFCRFYELAKAEAANGWPILHHDFARRAAMRLLGDCMEASLTAQGRLTSK
jgi:hypothetical protein